MVTLYKGSSACHLPQAQSQLASVSSSVLLMLGAKFCGPSSCNLVIRRQLARTLSHMLVSALAAEVVRLVDIYLRSLFFSYDIKCLCQAPWLYMLLFMFVCSTYDKSATFSDQLVCDGCLAPWQSCIRSSCLTEPYNTRRVWGGGPWPTQAFVMAIEVAS